jgi:putative DNA primase/helicase
LQVEGSPNELVNIDAVMDDMIAKLDAGKGTGKTTNDNGDGFEFRRQKVDVDALDLSKLGLLELDVRETIKHGCVRGDSFNGDRSKAVFYVACKLISIGIEPSVVVSILLDPAYGISEHVLEQNSQLRTARKTVQDAINKTKNNGQDRSKQIKSVEVINLKDIKPEPICWLWRGWFAQGKFHIEAGMYGDGKSQIALEFAAILSKGDNWPDGQKAPVKDVVIWSGEDKLEDVIVPRLSRMGANMERIHVIKSVSEDGAKREFNPATDMDMLEAAIEEINSKGGEVGLVIIDPIVAVASGKGDSHSNVDMRAALQPVVSLGERRNCAILGITHFTKGTSGRDPRERVTGSLAFGAVARLIMVTGARLNPKEGEAPRIFVRAKSNNGPDKGGFGYDFDVGPLRENTEIITSRVKWLDPLDGTARELLDDAEKGPNKDDERKRKAQEIRDWLQGFLRDGPKVSNEVFATGNKFGYSNDQIVRARKSLGLISTKGTFQGPATWSLPPF